MATQVAHDIKSPLVALNNYFNEAIQLDARKHQVIESSFVESMRLPIIFSRNIRESKTTPQEDSNDIDLMSFYLHPLIEEKKLRYKNCPIEISARIEQSAEVVYVSFNAERFKEPSQTSLTMQLSRYPIKAWSPFLCKKKIRHSR